MLELTENEIQLLRELNDAPNGERQISGNRLHDGLTSLVEKEYVVAHAPNMSTTLYSITEKGRIALKKNL